MLQNITLNLFVTVVPTHGTASNTALGNLWLPVSQ